MPVALGKRVVAFDAAVGDDGRDPSTVEDIDLHFLDGEVRQIATLNADGLGSGSRRIGQHSGCTGG